MRFVFWGPYVSMHQAALLRGIAGLGFECVWVVDRHSDEHRLAMGWNVPRHEQIEVISEPSQRKMRFALDERKSETVHILGGFKSCRTVQFASRVLIRHGGNFGWMVESLNPIGVSGACRRLLYSRWIARFSGRVNFVLAMGQLGVDCFRRLGFSSRRVFPFSYVVEPISAESISDQQPGQEYRIVFVGALRALKNVGSLIRATSEIRNPHVVLTVIGDGPLREQLEAAAERQKADLCVRFLGSLSNQETRNIIRQNDLLVLPSRYDGWGAVINEALMEGTPAVCSDRCGAADLLQEEWRGEVFSLDHSDALSSILRRRCSKGPLPSWARQRIQDWSHCLSGDSLARYFVNVVEHVYHEKARPETPWTSRSQRKLAA